MIQEISIKNFLSFKDKTVFSFEASDSKFREETQVVEVAEGVRLLRFAALYGANAAGKSNLMKAFYFINQFLFKDKEKDGRIDYPTGVVPFFLDDKTKTENSEFEIVFFVETAKNTYTKYIYKLEVNSETVVFEELSKENNIIVFQRKFQNNKFNTIYNFGIDDTTKAVFDLTCRKNMSIFAVYYNIEPNLPKDLDDLKNVKNYFMNFIPVVTGKKDIYAYTKEKLADDAKGNVKNKVLAGFEPSGFNISGISFTREEDGTIQDEFYIKVENQKEYALPGYLQSDGTKRYMSLNYIFHQLLEKQSFLIADEMETFIHPDLFEKIVYDFLSVESNHSQLILTTHYSGLMETVNNLIRVDSINFVEKKGDGSSELYRLTDFDDLEKFNGKDLTIYRGYREGRFGAVADIKY